MKILYKYLKNYWKLGILALVLAAINQSFSLMDPKITGMIIDKFATKASGMDSKEFFNGVLWLLGAAVGVAFISRVAKNFQDYFVNVVVQKMGAEMYTDGLKHSLGLSYAMFEDQSSGQTISILQKVRSDVERLVNAFVNILFTTLVGIVFVFVVASSIHWSIPLMFFGTVPILGVISSLLSKRIKIMQKKIVGETTALAGATTESLRNIELVKSLGLVNQEVTRLNNTTSKILNLELNKVKYIRSLSFIQGTVVNLLRTCIMFVMLYLIYGGSVTPGQYVSLMIYSFFIFGPLQELGNIINIYREAEVSLNNFEKIFAMPAEVKPSNPTMVYNVEQLAFENVSFKHQTAKNYALKNIDFEVDKGQTIAFVGPSGSGKTTLVKLLVGLYQPHEGSIKYNKINGKDMDLDIFREKIGFVTQDAQLFSGTIRENLLFVKPNATDEQLIEVLKKAACNNLLSRADNGLDTTIGEGGMKISGGEKQRLSIARALLRNPQLLVFDEATSALDSITEEEINETIRTVSAGREHITIMIAHRLSTIMHADKIFVLENGEIIEQGKHEALIEEKGLYYAMWRQQIGERKVELVS